jgi:Ca2+-binding EF-hand superfamily protein
VAAFFFVTFVLIGALILLTLFISVVQVSIEDSTKKLTAKKESFEKMVAFAAEDGIGRHACEGFLAAFDRIDKDGSGSLSVDELLDALIAVGFQV